MARTAANGIAVTTRSQTANDLRDCGEVHVGSRSAIRPGLPRWSAERAVEFQQPLLLRTRISSSTVARRSHLNEIAVSDRLPRRSLARTDAYAHAASESRTPTIPNLRGAAPLQARAAQQLRNSRPRRLCSAT